MTGTRCKDHLYKTIFETREEALDSIGGKRNNQEPYPCPFHPHFHLRNKSKRHQKSLSDKKIRQELRKGAR